MAHAELRKRIERSGFSCPAAKKKRRGMYDSTEYINLPRNHYYAAQYIHGSSSAYIQNRYRIAGGANTERFYDCLSSDHENDIQYNVQKQLQIFEVINEIRNPKEFKCLLKQLAYTSDALYSTFRKAYKQTKRYKRGGEAFGGNLNNDCVNHLGGVFRYEREKKNKKKHHEKHCSSCPRNCPVCDNTICLKCMDSFESESTQCREHSSQSHGREKSSDCFSEVQVLKCVSSCLRHKKLFAEEVEKLNFCDRCGAFRGGIIIPRNVKVIPRDNEKLRQPSPCGDSNTKAPKDPKEANPPVAQCLKMDPVCITIPLELQIDGRRCQSRFVEAEIVVDALPSHQGVPDQNCPADQSPTANFNPPQRNGSETFCSCISSSDNLTPSRQPNNPQTRAPVVVCTAPTPPTSPPTCSRPRTQPAPVPCQKTLQVPAPFPNAPPVYAPCQRPPLASAPCQNTPSEPVPGPTTAQEPVPCPNAPPASAPCQKTPPASAPCPSASPPYAPCQRTPPASAPCQKTPSEHVPCRTSPQEPVADQSSTTYFDPPQRNGGETFYACIPITDNLMPCRQPNNPQTRVPVVVCTAPTPPNSPPTCSYPKTQLAPVPCENTLQVLVPFSNAPLAFAPWQRPPLASAPCQNTPSEPVPGPTNAQEPVPCPNAPPASAPCQKTPPASAPCPSASPAYAPCQRTTPASAPCQKPPSEHVPGPCPNAPSASNPCQKPPPTSAPCPSALPAYGPCQRPPLASAPCQKTPSEPVPCQNAPPASAPCPNALPGSAPCQKTPPASAPCPNALTAPAPCQRSEPPATQPPPSRPVSTQTRGTITDSGKVNVLPPIMEIDSSGHETTQAPSAAIDLTQGEEENTENQNLLVAPQSSQIFSSDNREAATPPAPQANTSEAEPTANNEQIPEARRRPSPPRNGIISNLSSGLKDQTPLMAIQTLTQRRMFENTSTPTQRPEESVSFVEDEIAAASSPNAPPEEAAQVQTSLSLIRPDDHQKRNEIRKEIQAYLRELTEEEYSPDAKYTPEDKDEILINIYKVFHVENAWKTSKQISCETALNDIRYLLEPEISRTGSVASQTPETGSRDSILKGVKHVLNPKESRKSKTKRYHKETRDKILKEFHKMLIPNTERIEKKLRPRENIADDLRLMLDSDEASSSAERPTTSKALQPAPAASNAQSWQKEDMEEVLQDIHTVIHRVKTGIPKQMIVDNAMKDIYYILRTERPESAAGQNPPASESEHILRNIKAILHPESMRVPKKHLHSKESVLKIASGIHYLISPPDRKDPKYADKRRKQVEELVKILRLKPDDIRPGGPPISPLLDVNNVAPQEARESILSDFRQLLNTASKSDYAMDKRATQ